MGGSNSKPEQHKVPDIIIHNHLPGGNHASNSGPNAASNEARHIQQQSDGFSLVNFHWASFGTGFGLLFIVVGIFFAVGLCWFLRRKSAKEQRRQHGELLQAVGSGGPSSPPGPTAAPAAATAHPAGPYYSFRTPWGVSTVPASGNGSAANYVDYPRDEPQSTTYQLRDELRNILKTVVPRASFRAPRAPRRRQYPSDEDLEAFGDLPSAPTRK
jgi:hypothetical protein